MIPTELIQRDRTLLTQVQEQSVAAVTSMLPDLETLTQRGAGAVFRQVATGVSDQFGNVASVASTASYNDMRAAVKPLERELTLTLNYAVDLEVIDSVVGWAMSQFQDGNLAMAANSLATGVGLSVANAYRDNVVNLTEADPVAEGYQRVARPGACAFCAFAAAYSDPHWRGGVFQHTGKYHDHCHCTAVAIFKDVPVFKSKSMRQFEEDAHNAVGIVNAKDREAWAYFKEKNPGVSRREFLRAYPNYSMNTENILKAMRSLGYN